MVHAEADFWVFELPDGRHVEIFGYPGKEHFVTGPVAGFAVRDLPAAVDELIEIHRRDEAENGTAPRPSRWG